MDLSSLYSPIHSPATHCCRPGRPPEFGTHPLRELPLGPDLRWSASRQTIGQTAPKGLLCQAFTSSRTAPVTFKIRSGETSMSYYYFRCDCISRAVVPRAQSDRTFSSKPRHPDQALADELGLEVPVAASRNIDLVFAVDHLLGRGAIARVTGVPAFRRALLVAQLLGRHSVQRGLDLALHEPPGRAAVCVQILGGPVLSQLLCQLIEADRFLLRRGPLHLGETTPWLLQL